MGTPPIIYLKINSTPLDSFNIRSNMNKTIKLTIAIPTFERLAHLKTAIKHIRALSVPRDMSLHLAISNSESRDGTRDFLEALNMPEITLHKFNTPQWEFPRRQVRSNWVRLAGLVPAESDWVWLHGDDDAITDKKALHRIVSLSRHVDHPGLILFPAAARSNRSGKILSDSLVNLCQRYGFHEMLGWMSQLVMSGPLFINAMRDFARFCGESLDTCSHASGKKRGKHRGTKLPEDSDNEFVKRYVSAFHHSTMVLRNFRDGSTVFADFGVIEEQPPIVRKFESRIIRRRREGIRDRFFFLVDDFIKYLDIHEQTLTASFLRYVNKYLTDLMVNVIAEDLLSHDPSRQFDVYSKVARLQH